MEEKDKIVQNQNENADENGSGKNEPSNDTGANKPETNEADNGKITLTQDELDKRIQSAEDKLRTKYSKKIKDLEKKLSDITPVEKSEQEKDYEERLARLEARERAQELNEKLDSKGISRDFAKYISSDVDVEDFSKMLDNYVSSKNKQNAYVPTGHKSMKSLTKDEFRRMDSKEKTKLYNENPELYRTLRN